MRFLHLSPLGRGTPPITPVLGMGIAGVVVSFGALVGTLRLISLGVVGVRAVVTDDRVAVPKPLVALVRSDAGTICVTVTVTAGRPVGMEEVCERTTLETTLPLTTGTVTKLVKVLFGELRVKVGGLRGVVGMAKEVEKEVDSETEPPVEIWETIVCVMMVAAIEGLTLVDGTDSDGTLVGTDVFKLVLKVDGADGTGTEAEPETDILADMDADPLPLTVGAVTDTDGARVALPSWLAMVSGTTVRLEGTTPGAKVNLGNRDPNPLGKALVGIAVNPEGTLVRPPAEVGAAEDAVVLITLEDAAPVEETWRVALASWLATVSGTTVRLEGTTPDAKVNLGSDEPKLLGSEPVGMAVKPEGML